MFWKTGINGIYRKSSFSIFLRLSIWPRTKGARTESQTRNHCSLPFPGNEGRQSEGSGARNIIGSYDSLWNDTENHYDETAMDGEYGARGAFDTRTPAGGKEHLHIKPGAWVIVAEDDEVLRSLFGEALREKGFQVLPAANGLEALELYRENADKVWLVVTDVMMPGMDGLSAAIEMRRIDDNVFFLFMSGYDPQRIGENGITIKNIPNSDFFLKPFTFSDVISRIRILSSPHQT